MLNYNLNIIGVQQNVERLPFIVTEPTLSVRGDTSASFLVSAIPGTRFVDAFSNTYFNQNFFYSDISSTVRGANGSIPSGSNLPDAQISPSGSFTTSSITNFLLLGYSSSIQIESGSAAMISGSIPEINFSGSVDFTIESYINFELSASVVSQGTGSNAFLFYSEPQTKGLGFANTTVDLGKPGIRLMVNTTSGQVVVDSDPIGRNANQYYHYAVQRNGSEFMLLFDGKCIRRQSIFGNITSVLENKFCYYNRPEDPGNSTAQIRFQDHRIYKNVSKYGLIASGSSYTIPESMIYWNPPLPF